MSITSLGERRPSKRNSLEKLVDMKSRKEFQDLIDKNVNMKKKKRIHTNTKT